VRHQQVVGFVAGFDVSLDNVIRLRFARCLLKGYHLDCAVVFVFDYTVAPVCRVVDEISVFRFGEQVARMHGVGVIGRVVVAGADLENIALHIDRLEIRVVSVPIFGIVRRGVAAVGVFVIVFIRVLVVVFVCGRRRVAARADKQRKRRYGYNKKHTYNIF